MENKNKYIVFLFVGLAAFSLWHYQKKSNEKVNISNEVDFEQSNKLGEVSQQAPKLKDNELIEKYERQKLKRPVFKTDLGEIANDITNIDDLKKLSIRIKNRKKSDRSDFEYDPETKWDLNNDLPSSKSDFVSLIEEAKIKALNLLVDAALSEDYSMMRKAVVGYHSIIVLGGLEFQGYDEEKKLILKFPDNYQATNKKIRAKSKLILEKKRSVANSGGADEEESRLNLEVLLKEKLEQTPYFTDLETSEKAMDEYYGGESSLLASLSEMADYLINTISKAEIFSYSPKKAHERVIETVDSVIADAADKPEEYGVRGRVINDVSDLDFEIFAEVLSAKTALFYGLSGAALSTVLGDMLIDRFQQVRIFSAGLLVSVGVESLFAALGSYWGNYLLNMLHRYQNYIRDAKEFTESRGKGFAIKNIAAFKPEIVFHSETMRMELNKSWLWGYSFGRIANRYFTIKGVNSVGRFVALQAITVARGSSRPLLARTGKAIYLLRPFFTKTIAESMAKVIALPGISNPWVRGIMSTAKKLASFTPAKVASVLLDFTITSYVIYASIHTKLYASTQMFSRIYYAPEMSVHLAMNNEWNKGTLSFKQASREIFYSLCHYMATNDLNNQKMTEYDTEDENSFINKLYNGQKKNCLKIISAFEGVPEEKIEEHMRILGDEQKIDNRIVDLYFNKSTVTKDEMVTSIARMHVEFPEYYRNIWVTGLKSIYGKRYLPEQFFSIKNIILTGEGGDQYKNQNSYFNISINRAAEKVNTLRFEYIIERLAYSMKILKVEKKIARKDDPLDLTESFVTFWTYHSKNSKKVDAEILKLLKEGDKGFWSQLWNGVKSAGKNLKFLLSRWWTPPYENTNRFAAEKKAQEMLNSGPSASPRCKDSMHPRLRMGLKCQ